MNDPHVEALYYRFVTEDDSDDFSQAAPLSGSLGDFDFTLADGHLVARPRLHFASADDAIAALEPHLRAWEQSSLVSRYHYAFRFRYLHPHLIDRAPTPGNQVIELVGIASTATFGIAAVVRRSNYPPPADDFAASDLTDLLTPRYDNHRRGREPLPSFGYWLLTVLEQSFGKGRRRRAASALHVQFEVLDTIGKLTSKADPAIGRKAAGDAIAFTPAELAWLDAVVARLIYRVGERNTGIDPLPLITLADFPKLT